MSLLSRLFTSKSAQGYALHRLEPGASEPDTFLLTYEWDDSFDNREWRPCVRRFLQEVEMHGHEVEELPSPEFTPEDPRVILSVWNDIGNKVGWAA